ncbi:hypothetical protein KQX54_012349 [Cotesia glomerata]|uniref:Uncharacterized protein n=1 Tax=Cotesia glomerata TaxID=32391 RepID=A0AAV7J463_COTGL|nr:hypothetical protein KQX54_012349 [Cotesia glomerata]
MLQLHHAMTPEDLHKIFSVKSATDVLMQKPFGDDLRIWLDATDGTLASVYMPVCFLQLSRWKDNLIYDCQIDSTKNLTLYENIKNAATVVVNETPYGKHSVKGFIGNQNIQPVPPHLIDHARRHQRSLNTSPDHESDDHGLQLKEALTSKRAHYREITVSETIYTEIIVIIDYSMNSFMHAQTLQDKIIYLLAFWNGVDIRYRNLVNPKIRLNIARIVFAEDPEVLPYVN